MEAQIDHRDLHTRAGVSGGVPRVGIAQMHGLVDRLRSEGVRLAHIRDGRILRDGRQPLWGNQRLSENS